MKTQSEKILKFDDDWKPMHWPPIEEGYYMTIRCGLTGIYTHIDQWKNNKWQVGILDGSDVIAYSKEQLTKEDILQWYEDIKNKVKNKTNDV